ncbi:malto-oligosyltrehalose trehalohydrolase [Tautonia plasticadhaerens]|uniref:Malto-oligosyltrehalose trehalohydrolase n=1 Tax=Tautonia plasticadhaerens TaxID=2527974 RepID=A0A518H726_9BACT|nr:malto-oligosyltrehalose trehalohydrolase [Tautonia plasticadhaerens]QDV36665.1 Malto-oligosyltrehalose trehalohydrolase [Tautonia plasticadhaerens]
MSLDRRSVLGPSHWRPSIGAWPERDGVRFRVWAPKEPGVSVVIEGDPPRVEPLERHADGTFGALVDGLGPGARYRYRISSGEFPDPASRFQPEGVHGPSEVVDPGHFRWLDRGWTGLTLDELVVYELHVGTFSPEGTFDGVTGRLPYLRDLGVTAVELMPVADFPGDRNWGYDGAALYAPSRRYGRPDDLRRLVDTAHRLGLAVLLDVVYNHLGPDGCYLPAFSPYVFSEIHSNPWGKSLNFDDTHSTLVRQFFIENALHWVHEYRVDGLRLDATHAIIDDSDRPFVADLASRVRESVADREVLVIAEDHRNLAQMIRPEGEGGWGLDGVWADDFHHIVRVALAGEHEGYYRDFTGSMAELADCLVKGWLYTGQHSTNRDEHRGSEPIGVPPRRMVVCTQNHDQIGNRAMGDRLHHGCDLAAYRASSALLLCAPETPMLFQGQEWATGTPFQFFTDHEADLGRAVTEGRRQEFRHFAAFADPASRDRIPDPQAEATFLGSRLDWSEPDREPYASTLRLFRALLTLRRSEPALKNARIGSYRAAPLSDHSLLLRNDAEVGPSLLVVFHLGGAEEVSLSARPELDGLDVSRCQLVLTTDERPFAPDGRPPAVSLDGDAPAIRFEGPSAVLIRAWPVTSR